MKRGLKFWIWWWLEREKVAHAMFFWGVKKGSKKGDFSV
jgi:hypothetical protein